MASKNPVGGHGAIEASARDIFDSVKFTSAQTHRGFGKARKGVSGDAEKVERGANVVQR